MQAIGDSLTYGESYTVTSDGKKIMTHNPYTNHLNNLMSVARASNEIVIAVERGRGGENTSHMLKRIEDELQEFSEKMPPLKAVAILGGTIDVLNRRKVSAIMPNIIGMHEKVLRYTFANTATAIRSNKLIVQSQPTNQNQLFSIAMTIPPIDTVHGSIEIDNLRLSLNQEIRRFAGNCEERIVLVDLENIYNQSYAAEEHNWSPDLLHFSAKGYLGVANMVHYGLLSFLDVRMTMRGKKAISDEEFYAKCFPGSSSN